MSYTKEQYEASARKHGIPCGPWRSHTGGTPHCDATRGDVFHLCDDAEFDRIRDTLASLPDLLIALDEQDAEIERLRKAIKKTCAWLDRVSEQARNEATIYRGRHDSLADSALHDSKNYAAIAKDMRAALKGGA